MEVVNPVRSTAHHPLFQVMLILQNTDEATVRLPGLTVELDEADTGAARMDLAFNMEELHTEDRAPAGLTGTVEFATDLFDPATARELAARLERLLQLRGRGRHPSARCARRARRGRTRAAARGVERHRSRHAGRHAAGAVPALCGPASAGPGRGARR